MKKKALKRSRNASNQKYKDLTGFLFKFDEPKIDRFIASHTKHELDNFKFRVYNQVSGYSHLVWYLDKYMNNLYDWSKFDFKEFIYTMNTILRMTGIINQSNLLFTRYQNVQRNDIYKTFSDYFKIVKSNTEFNNNDLACLFKLYELGSINDEDLTTMKSVIDPKPEGKAAKLTSPKIKVNTMFADTVEEIEADIESPEIIAYKNNILNFIKTRASCNTCPLHKSGFLLLNTNSKGVGPIDVAFIINGSSSMDISKQEILSSVKIKSSLLQICAQFKLTYAFISMSACDIDNAATAPKRKQTYQACRGIFEEMKTTFSAKINILFGDDVRVASGIKTDKCTKLHGTQVMNNIISIAADKLNAKTERVLFATMIDTFKSTKFETTANTVNISELDNSKIISRITPDLTLFDIKEINSKILYILINKEGSKVYYIEDMQFPVYVKSGSMAECQYIDDMDKCEEILVSKQELQTLKKATRSNLTKHMRM